MSTCCGVSGAASPGSSIAPSMADVTAEEMEETGVGKQKYKDDAIKQQLSYLLSLSASLCAQICDGSSQELSFMDPRNYVPHHPQSTASR